MHNHQRNVIQSTAGNGTHTNNNNRRPYQSQSQPYHQNRSQATLNIDQVRRLYAVMREQFEVHGRGNFPTLSVCLRRLIRTIMTRMQERGLTCRRAKMNGGAASYVLASTKNLPYNDIDLIFDVDLSPTTNVNRPGSSGTTGSAVPLTTTSAKLDAIKNVVFDSLIEFLPPDANKAKISAASMKDAYVRKMVKVCEVNHHNNNTNSNSNSNNGNTNRTNNSSSGHNSNNNNNGQIGGGGDLWSLISLNNDYGRYIELKFVDRMRRQFEFSVDSFQIDLGPIVRRDSLSGCVDQSENSTSRTEFGGDQSNLTAAVPLMDEDENVKITAESVYGNFRIALKHLNEQLIDTVQPELIRGGGLLKYVNLLVRGYRPARPAPHVYRMERYMCSRFFIDFGSCEQQQRKLRLYLDNHFHHDLRTKYEYLLILHKVVDESTVCLMNHELRMSLNLIEQLSMEVQMELCYQQQLAVVTENMAHLGANGAGPHHFNNNNNNNNGPQHISGAGPQHFECRCRRASAGSSTATSIMSNMASSSSPGTPGDQNPFFVQQQQQQLRQQNCQQHPQCQQLQQQPPVADGNGGPQHFQMKQTLLFVPHNASYWIPVV